MAFKRKTEIIDREAWLLAVCIRAFKFATSSGSPRLWSTDVNRVCDYLKQRFGK